MVTASLKEKRSFFIIVFCSLLSGDTIRSESLGKMKVLLVQDVEKLGHAGDVKEVAGGFGRNYLIPKGFAVLATRGQIRQAEERLQGQRRREMLARRDAEALASRIQGVTLKFVARTGEQGKLYGSVTSMEVASRLAEQLEIEVDRRKIDLSEPIKRIGIYPIKVKLVEGLEPVFNVVVEAETEPEAAPVTEATTAEAEESVDIPPDPEADE
jgi:large subunit ribosomal protein L9